MSAPNTTSALEKTGGQANSSSGTPGPGRTRSHRWVWWVIGGVAVAVVLVLAVLALVSAAGSRSSNTTPLDPGNRGGAGTSALASIIDDHGVDVSVVRGLDSLRATSAPGSDTTVVISGETVISTDVAEAIFDRVRSAHRVVLIDPSYSLLAAFTAQVSTSYSESLLPVSKADCTLDGISPSDLVTSDSSNGFTGGLDSTTGVTPCFSRRQGGGANLVSIAAEPGGPPVVAMTAPMTLNQNLARYDNSGVAIRTIATTDHVLWYVPQRDDTVPDQSSNSDQHSSPSVFPRAVGPLFLLAFFAVLALILWRGRRFGPLATEPLPAVVKAIETTRSRGRMYRRAGAADRAAAVLRVHTIAGIAGYLGLPYDPGHALDSLDEPDADTHATDPALASIISAVADATGRDPAQVKNLLAGPLPTTDPDLVRFTDALTALDKEVLRRP
ncbi:DUF4350 domain-containing protein [Gordonia sp. L191]|uniref:DUF4350 domain-containing protein n=1 Tax=Gordonia sp. L191 TaxID=2982699 RepID=UPI0024C03850|nr:DUF4350 domain-containing protein [Gordonia sp. L191]WHU46998.1 DUF4350 domain-containing protein [Gordonia sp. L191]